MNYLLDTNILVYLLKENTYTTDLETQYSLLSSSNRSAISVVSVGEIESLAIQNKWGNKRLLNLKELLNKFIIADINIRTIIEKYAEIDAYSQAKHPKHSSDFTSRNMGKNDLWIAATASVLKLKLLTTDQDYNHLNKSFIDLELVKFEIKDGIQ